jgi:SAM-dependent methyltransferase
VEKNSSLDLGKKWRKLMKYQVDLLFPMELPFYMRLTEWNTATTIVDLGTGNGYYLYNLAAYFPYKCYIGVDLLESNIRAAVKYYQRHWQRKEYRPTLIHSDIFKLTGTYDAIIARLLVQHLKSLDLFLHLVRHLLGPNGALFIIESCDSDRRFLPEVPMMQEFFSALRTNRIASGCNRDAGEIIASNALRFGLRASHSALVTASSAVPGLKNLFLRTYLTVFDLARDEFNLDFDYRALKNNLITWHRNPSAYTHLSLRMLCFTKGG